MKLYSTNNKQLRTSFQEGVFKSLPADNGLYMPVEIPQLNGEFLQHIEEYSFQEIAFEVSKTLLQDAIPQFDLHRLINDAIDFDAPVVNLDEHTAVLELFHGPSLAFKDFGARFMSRVMSYFQDLEGKTLDVLVATSGDTGGAVAQGFLGVPKIRVTILYPKGKVSAIQEAQLTSNGKNIRALEIQGSFDDCQALVKKAFLDAELRRELQLTSANSINISRLIPQAFYYFWAYAQLKKQGKKNLIFAVPSGNFGNLTAGVLAYRMGLPVTRFIAGTNANDTVPYFLKTGKYRPKPSVQTYSNAMDVSNPSNWMRIMDLLGERPKEIEKLLVSFSFSDEQTLGGIEEIYRRYKYIACPHTAIAWLAVQAYKRNIPKKNETFVFLSTAHPCKFPKVFPKNIREEIDEPERIKTFFNQRKNKVELPNSFSNLKSFLLGNSNDS